MNISEMKQALSNIISDYLDKKIQADEAIKQLITMINPEDVYELENEFLITDCYFAIKHLTEQGYQTIRAELQYFRECFLGKRIYNLNEKNEFIIQDR